MIARRISICLLALSVVCTGPVSAQDDNNLVQLITVQVRPGTNAMFEEYVKAVREASREQGLENYWFASQSVSGPPVYTIGLQRGSWASLNDAAPALAEAYGEEEAARLEGLLRRSVSEVNNEFYRTRMDLSVPNQAGPIDGLIYYRLGINQGMMGQYIEGSMKTREASLAVVPDSAYIVQIPQMGANGVRVVGFVRSWSDLDEGIMNPGARVIEHFGQQEGQELISMINETINSIEMTVHRPRGDLNHFPED